MLIKKSRRNFLEKTLKAISITGLTSIVGCETSIVDNVDNYKLFNGDVELTKTETTEGFIDKFITSMKLEFKINKTGNYLFEGWVQNYRDVDSLEEKYEYEVNESGVPYKKTVNLNSLVYRLEATRTNEKGKIERDTAKFIHYGLIGHFQVAGQPMTKSQ